MATTRPPIKNVKERHLSPPSRPRVALHSPTVGRSQKIVASSASETEASDADEFEGFDQIDRSAPRDSSYSIYPDLSDIHSPINTSTPKYLNCESSSSHSLDTLSPLKTDCESPFQENKVYQRHSVRPKGSLVSDQRSRENRDQEIQHRRYIHGGRVVAIAMCILVIISLIFLFVYLPRLTATRHPQQKKKNLTDVYEEIKVELRSIKNSLGQTRHLWTQILGQVTSLVEEPITQPSVIMAIVPKNSEKTAICLIDSLSRMIKQAFDDDGFVMFDVTSHLRSPNSLKEELDESLSGLDETHVAIVYNIEKLPGDVAMMLHAYCDHENAPFKRAIIFLTLEVDLQFDEIDARKLDLVASQFLMDSWMQNIREEDVSSLIARVANAPILIKPESTEICDF